MMKILIADDDAISRIAIGRLLEKWGYDVVQADDGRGAWESLRQKDPPRIAILDWMMPEPDGVEICRLLKEENDFPFIYTILLSVRQEKEDIVSALDSGGHDFLSKPVHREQLTEAFECITATGIGFGMKNRELAEINDQLTQTNADLQSALKEIQTLQGILPICVHCKKIRLEHRKAEDPDSWVRIEEYIGSRTKAEFSHGICPICAAKHYPDYC